MNQPASIDLKPLPGARILYAYTQNLDGSPDIVETGTIRSAKQLKDGRVELYVTPDNPQRMSKYRIADTHLLRYLHSNQTAKATA